MDCYIVRVYRHITPADGQPDEIAGLVERVGIQDGGKSFSTYGGLVDALRDGPQMQLTDERETEESPVDSVRSVRSIRSR